jgi:DNA-binding NtrC family response regulator
LGWQWQYPSFGEYEILQAAGPQSALETAEQHPIDLLLSDCVMQSKSSGPELARKITASYSHVKVVLMSGSEDYATLHLNRDWQFIQKPFSTAVLRTTIMEALAEQPKARTCAQV